MNKRKLLIGLGIVVFLILPASWQLYNYWQHRGLDRVRVEVIPEDSTLTVDGRRIKPGTIYLKPGLHRLAASRQYFDNDAKTINTSEVKNEIIYLLPKANSEEAIKWLSEHPEIQQQMEAAGGAEAERNRRLLLKKYPIFEELPVETARYKIDYSVEEPARLKLTITLYGVINGPEDYPEYQKQLKQYQQEALAFLRSRGVSPSDFEIDYIPDIEN